MQTHYPYPVEMSRSDLPSWGDKMLPFLAVGRVKDSVTLAYFYNSTSPAEKEQEIETKKVFTKLLAQSGEKLSAGERTRLQWNDGSVCCLMDQQGLLLYCVVTSMLTFPERVAFQLLSDLVLEVQSIKFLEELSENALNRDLDPKMRELVRHYEEPKNFPQFARSLGDSKRDTLGPSDLPLVYANRSRSGNSWLSACCVTCCCCLLGVAAVIAVVVSYFLPGRPPSQALVDALPGVAALVDAPVVYSALRRALGNVG